MLSKFKADLLQLRAILHPEEKAHAGYTTDRLHTAEKRLGIRIPETLRTVYETIAKDAILAKDFYPPEQLTLVHEPRAYYGKFEQPIHPDEIEAFLNIRLTEEQRNSDEPLVFSGIIGEYAGIEFADTGWMKLAYFPDCRRDSDYAVFEKLSRKTSGQLHFGVQGTARNDLQPPFSDFLKLFTETAIEHMPHIASFASLKACNDYLKTAEKLGFRRLESYIPYQASYQNTDILFSDCVLLRFDDLESPKLVIASNDLKALEAIGAKVKLKWLRKHGQKIINPKYFCTETIPESFTDQLLMIYQIYYGKNCKPVNENKIVETEQRLGCSLPEELRLFYQYFGGKQTLFESSYTIPKLKELTIENGFIPFAIEEQGVCSYQIKADTGDVFYENNGTLEKDPIALTSFLLRTIVQQGTGFLCAVGTISKDSGYQKFFCELPSGNETLYINQKRKLIGMDWEDSILIMSRTQDAFYKLYDQCGLVVSEL